jgi:hypothetical protein
MREQKRRQRQSGGDDTTPRLGPLSYCAYAVEYLDAARAAGTPGTRFKPAQTYLACHAIELALGAYLSTQGTSVDRMGRNLDTHNLWRLLEDAEARGLGALARLSAAQRKQIRKATAYYAQNVFEFPAFAEAVRGHPDAPEVAPLLAAASVLVAAALKAIGVRTARTRKPSKRP